MKKGIIYISFISLLILFWSGTALAISAPNLISPQDGAAYEYSTTRSIKITFEWSQIAGAGKGYYLSILNSYNEELSYFSYPSQNTTKAELEFFPASYGLGTYKWRVKACRAKSYTLGLVEDCSIWSPERSFKLIAPQQQPVPGFDPTKQPYLQSVSPTTGAVGTAITIAGNNFSPDCPKNTLVSFTRFDPSHQSNPEINPPDNCSLSTSQNSFSFITTKIPAFSGAGTNEIQIKVVTTGIGISRTSNPLNFLIEGRPDGNLTGTGSDGGQTPQGKLQVKWPKTPLGTPLQGDSLTNLVKYLYEWGISLGGFAAFVVLVMAGFQYLTSAGDAGKMKEAIDKIRNAVIGLVMLFASVLILNTVNPQLTQLKMPSLGETFTSQCFDCMEKNKNDWKKKCTNECGLIAEDKIDITMQCGAGARVYTASDCQGSGQSIQVSGNGKDITCTKQGTCSIKAEEKNMCAAEFYDKIGCSGEPMAKYFIGTDCTNLDTLGFERDIRCVKIKKPK